MASPQGEVMISFTGAHGVKDILLTGVRWYRASPWS
jgi:hypothetical protein